jgi:hypothetical protein
MWLSGQQGRDGRSKKRKTLSTYRFLNSAKLFKLLAQSSLLGMPGEATVKNVSVTTAIGETDCFRSQGRGWQ